MGMNPLYEHLQMKLGIAFGGTTPDGRFTLLPSVCLGACDQAPCMMVNFDYHTGLTQEKIEKILASLK